MQTKFKTVTEIWSQANTQTDWVIQNVGSHDILYYITDSTAPDLVSNGFVLSPNEGISSKDFIGDIYVRVRKNKSGGVIAIAE